MRRGFHRLSILALFAGTVVLIELGCQNDHKPADSAMQMPPTTLTQDHHPPPRTPEN